MEMLVAMIISGIVAWMALEMFSGQKGNYTRTRDKIRMQNDAREAMRVIEEDVRNAGFRTQVDMEATGLVGKASSCDANVLDGDQSALSPGNSDLLSGDTLRVRFMAPRADGSVHCSDHLTEVGYYQRHDTLFRMTDYDTTQPHNWVPILDNVVTFQVEYGLLVNANDTPVTSAAFGTPAKWGGGTTVAASGSGVAINGWGTSNTVALLSGVPIALNHLYTYHVVFDLSMNDSMRIGTDAAGTNGIDSNTTSGLPMFWIGFFNSSGTATDPGDTLYQYPGSHPGTTAYRRVEAYINPTSPGTRYFGICSKLKSGSNTAAKGQGITISNGTIDIFSHGQYFQWLNAPTHAQKPHVKALKVNLLVKTSNTDKEGVKAKFTNLDATPYTPLSYTASGSDTLKSHILYQRIIPVVNNGI
jgi:type II secretory pathway component PulJ